jgi:molybdopterin-guanine dinucleotide biosynthesis protein A
MFTGVVLAGGQSSRMGYDKAHLVINNKTLLQHASDLLIKAGAANVLISRNTTEHSDYIQDIYPNNGPLGGIYSTLLVTNNDVLITAVDMPLLMSEQLTHLVKNAQLPSLTDHGENSAWYLNDEPLPLFIKNTEHVRATLKGLLTTLHSRKSIKHFITFIGAHTVQCNQPGTLINTNTPTQFKNAINSLSNINCFNQ